MTPRQLRAFAAIAETLSFARACERLHMSAPALSLAIRNLERTLGGRLFVRTTRSVRLTPEGVALLAHAKRLLADWEGVRERLKQQFTLQRGHVTIAAMPSFAGNVLPRVLRKFSDRFPGVEVSVHDVIQEQVLEMVESGRVEIGFGFEPEGASDLAFEPLLVDQFIAIVSSDSVLRRGRSVTWSQLLNQKFIALQRPSSTRSLLERSLAEHGLNLTVTLECHQLTTIGQFVAAGLGVSVVPAICRQQMMELGAVCLPVSRPKIRKPIGLITRADRQLSTAVHSVRSIVEEILGDGVSITTTH